MLSWKVECCDIAGAVNVLEVYMTALIFSGLQPPRRFHVLYHYSSFILLI